MGGIAPIAGGVGSLVSTLNTANQIFGAVQGLRGGSDNAAQAEQALALQQLQARQRLQQQQALQDAALKSHELSLQAQQDEDKRRAALRRAVARQRAQFGGSGVGSGGGSSQAVLLGLFDETEDELARRNQLDNLRNTALGVDLTQQKNLNVLQRTQLQERQQLQNAASSSSNKASDYLSFGLDVLKQFT